MQKNTSANSTVTVGSSNGIVWILVKKASALREASNITDHNLRKTWKH